MPDNIILVILAGMVVLLMQGGFALVTSGLCRAKNAGQVVTMNFMIFPLSILGFWVCGFTLMFGGALKDPATFGSPWSSLHGMPSHPMGLMLFFYQAAVVAVAAAIP